MQLSSVLSFACNSPPRAGLPRLQLCLSIQLCLCGRHCASAYIASSSLKLKILKYALDVADTYWYYILNFFVSDFPTFENLILLIFQFPPLRATLPRVQLSVRVQLCLRGRHCASAFLASSTCRFLPTLENLILLILQFPPLRETLPLVQLCLRDRHCASACIASFLIKLKFLKYASDVA